jgi:hypothetical protein
MPDKPRAPRGPRKDLRETPTNTPIIVTIVFEDVSL